jgi:hypothetical protein
MASRLVFLGVLSFLICNNTAHAQNVSLLCDYQLNIRSIDARNQVIQDDWYSYQSEYQLAGGTYFVSTFDQSGNVSSARGSIQVTPRKYFLITSSSADGYGREQVSKEAYIDRITGQYHASTVIYFYESDSFTSFISSGNCSPYEAPKPKF